MFSKTMLIFYYFLTNESSLLFNRSYLKINLSKTLYFNFPIILNSVLLLACLPVGLSEPSGFLLAAIGCNLPSLSVLGAMLGSSLSHCMLLTSRVFLCLCFFFLAPVFCFVPSVSPVSPAASEPPPPLVTRRLGCRALEHLPALGDQQTSCNPSSHYR